MIGSQSKDKITVRSARRMGISHAALLVVGIAIGCTGHTETLDTKSERKELGSRASRSSAKVLSENSSTEPSTTRDSNPSDRDEDSRSSKSHSPIRAEFESLVRELQLRYPSHPDAMEVKARFHWLLGETESAKETWEEILRFAPKYPFALHGLGRYSLLHSRYEEAVTFLCDSLQNHSNNTDAVHDLSDAFFKLGEIQKSVEILESHLEKNPKSPQTLVLLGQSLLALEKNKEAEEAFRSAMALAPNRTRAEQGLGTALLRMGNREEAQDLLKKQREVRAAASKLPTDEELLADENRECAKHFRLAAGIYLARGDARTAEQILKRSLELDPQSPSGRREYFSFLEGQRRDAELLSFAHESVLQIPGDPSWRFTLGVLQAKEKDFSGAMKTYRELIAMAPGDSVGYESLIRMMIQLRQDPAEILSWSKKLVELRGSAADHELLGQAYALSSDLVQAHRSLSEAIRLDPSNKNYAEAMKHLKRALGQSP